MSTEPSLRDALSAATPKDALTIARTLEQAGHRAWLVGGCVRDLIRLWRGHPAAKTPADFDLCTDALPEVVLHSFRRVIPTGIAHGTVTVVLGGRHFEVTTLRGERGYSDGRRPDEVFFVSDLELDLARRDFTVNAMAFDICRPELIDPFGGRADLEQGILRAVGDPLARFSEDGLRVLRCARFCATLGLEVEAATKAAMRPSLDSFAKVAGERVRDEWFKALASPKPSRTFRLLRTEGLLAVTAPELFPESSPIVDDAYETTCELLDQAESDPIFRLSLLVVGALEWAPDRRANPTAAARAWTLLLTRSLKLSGAEKNRLGALAEAAAELTFACPDLDGEPALRRFMRRIGADFVSDVARLIALSQGFERASAVPLAQLGARLSNELDRKPALALRDLRLTGGDLISTLGMQPGPEVGRLLERLLELVLDDPAQNDKEQLLSLARQLK